MGWTLLPGVVLMLGIALVAVLSRRNELARMERALRKRRKAVRSGSAEAQLRHPVVDLSRCLGCGTCVASCPEDGVLDLVHGQAVVINGARCMGYAICERECPVGAITVTVANQKQRDDIPAISDGLEAIGTPGLFLAGEVTAHTLIKTAVDQGTAVAAEVAKRVRETAPEKGESTETGTPSSPLDLCIVGAGPAGLACALEAKRHGLSFILLDQEAQPGGTVAKYPRRKLVLSQPLEIPLYGKFKKTSFTKEELVELWERIIAEQGLPLRNQEIFQGLETRADGSHLVATDQGSYPSRHVCLALGRRGTPRHLGVAGEDLPKVAYSLLDAQSYQRRRILVVGGGDSAVEAAVGLAEQPGNQVTLSYRKETFFRLRAHNERRLAASVDADRLQVATSSRVLAIHPESVDLEVQNGAGPKTLTLPNDEVFVMAGGTAPTDLLRSSGISFDPDQRPEPAPLAEQGTGLAKALSAGLLLSLLALGWALWNADYYWLAAEERPLHGRHNSLRPGMGVGLALGVAAAALIVVNLLYLVRRSPRFRFSLGSLKVWMTSHVATGILAFLCAILHGAMTPGNTVGGHAFWGLVALLITGAIGRYIYAYVPRAANGRELELLEVKAHLGKISRDWDHRQKRFQQSARNQITALIDNQRWRGSLFHRIFAFLGTQRSLRLLLRDLSRQGRREGVPEEQIRETVQLARKLHRTALMIAHYEDLRGIINSWRYLHRWIAVLLVLLVILHVVSALSYGSLSFGGSAG